MKSFFACALFVLSGVQTLRGQAPQTTAQFDLWNWSAVKAPAPAQGIVVDPVYPDTWYLACGNGLYITHNDGATWTQYAPNAVSKEGIAIDPLNANQIYAGSGSSVYTVPFGSSFPTLNTTWSIAEDGSGGLWAATEGPSPTAGKNMILRSADRGATWVDVTGPLVATPSKLLWDGSTGALYAASTGGGVIVTGNQGARWVAYTHSAALSVAVAPLPSAAGVGSGVIAGLDASGGGGAAFTFALSHSDLVSSNTSPSPVTTAMGTPQTVPITSVSLNHAGTRFVATGGDGSIYTGTVMQPQLNPASVTVVAGGSLIIGCQTSPGVPGMDIVIAGQRTTLQFVFGPSGGTLVGLRWDVPAGMPPGTYPAQLMTTFPPISITVIVSPSVTTSPTISGMTSLRYVQKVQYGSGEVVSLFGTALTGAIGNSGTNYSTTLPLASQLALAQVVVDGASAPLYYAYTGPDGQSQINFQIPSSLAPGTHKLHVTRFLPSGAANGTTADFSFAVSGVSPTYIVDSSGNAYVQDITQGPAGDVFANVSATPAHPGDVATIYATGLGATSPAVAAGSVPPAGTLANVAAPVSVSLWDGLVSTWKADVLGAVASPQFPGLYQIAFRLPADAVPNGSTMKLVVMVGSDTQTFTVNFIR